MMNDRGRTGNYISPAAYFFSTKNAKQNGLPRRWQTVLFLKDDIKGRYYSWRKVLFLFWVSAGSTEE